MIESFPCEEVCPGLDGEQRSFQHCNRRDLPAVDWKDGDAFTAWMGRPPDRDGERRGEPGWFRPHEPLSEGCPAGWYRCEFARSLELYLPQIFGETAMESPMLSREAPRFLLEAVQLYKHHHAVRASWVMEVLHGS